MNSRLRKYLFRFLGIVSLVLAYIGILLPGVPAIPFILLSGYCFLQGSPGFYHWLSERKYIGTVLKKYNGKTSNAAIWFIISQLWVSLIVLQFILRPSVEFLLIINFAGIACSIFIYKILSRYS